MGRRKRNKRKIALLTTTVTLCALQGAKRRKTTSPSCWVRKWIERRNEWGFSNTLIREIEQEDSNEYKGVFRMDKDTFNLLPHEVTPRSINNILHDALRDAIRRKMINK